MKDNEKQLDKSIKNEIKQDFKMHEKKHKQIEEMAKDCCLACTELYGECNCKEDKCPSVILESKRLIEKGWIKTDKDSVVLSKEEYEKLKSLYDTQKGAIITSNIGDLPLTVEGLRKAIDEITRLNRVETELQELNAKYYNEAKDLRREVNRLKAHAKINDEHLHIRIKNQASKETAEKFANEVYKELYQLGKIYALPETLNADKYGVFSLTQEVIVKIAKEQFGVEIKENKND